MKYWVTSEGVQIPWDEIKYQHMSNIVWMWYFGKLIDISKLKCTCGNYIYKINDMGMFISHDHPILNILKEKHNECILGYLPYNIATVQWCIDNKKVVRQQEGYDLIDINNDIIGYMSDFYVESLKMNLL